MQRPGEDALELGASFDLALDVADHAAEIGFERAQRLVGALELMGMDVTLMLDQRMLADPRIGLAQQDASSPGQPHQPFARPLHEPGVGREHDVLGLHRGIDDDPREIRRLGGSGAVRDAQALLDQRHQPLSAHALAPAGQRRAVERRLVLEKLLAAEMLEIGVLDPAIA